MFFGKKFYRIKKGEISIYQLYFDKILGSINVVNTTNWLNESRGNFDQYRNDDIKTREIINSATKYKVNPNYLQIMFDQYILADPWAREKYKNSWVDTVLKRKRLDFFPDPWCVLDKLYHHNDNQ
jgi:hypothetical protein